MYKQIKHLDFKIFLKPYSIWRLHVIEIPPEIIV
jgi:hypothetical protein